MKRKSIISYVLSLCMLVALISACSKEDKVENTAANKGLATLATAVATSYSQYEATLSGSVVADGSSDVTEWGICVGLEPAPTEQLKATGSKDAFSVQVSNLEGGRLYYYRAYAINANGISYGEEKIFTTAPILPVVETVGAIVENVTITFTGKLKFDGGISLMEKGFCYGTMAEPTAENSTVVTLSGNDFAITVYDDLEPFTYYYVRAYAVNAVGMTYGDVVKIRTQDYPVMSMPFVENFSGGVVPPNKMWKMLDHDGDGYNWYYSKYKNLTAAASDSYGGSRIGALFPYNLLITPKILIKGDNPVVTWKVAGGHSSYYRETYKLVVSEVPISSANCEDASIVKTLFEETMLSNEWQSRSVSLTDYIGKEVFFAWVHYNCTNVYDLHLTDINVKDLPSTDPSLIFPESFTAAVFPPKGWTIIDHDGDGNNWVKSTSTRLTVGAMSDSENGLAPYNLLVTPKFEVKGTNPVFSWEAGALGSPTGSYYKEHYKVVVSTLGNSFADFDETKAGVTNVYEETMTSSFGRAYVSRSVNFSAFIGKEVYVAIIHYDCADQVSMVIKNINLSGN